MKILILFIYNKTEMYEKMLQIQKTYIHNHPDIDVYFVTLTKQDEPIILKDDFIYVKGEEHLLTITYKTVKALEYIFYNLQKKYDFVVRSNISTLINLNNLVKFFNTVPSNMLYTGGTLWNLGSRLDYDSGINPDSMKKYRLQNLNYVQGTSIIMSYDVVKYILEKKHLINYSIVDDVTFGLFIRNNLPIVYKNIMNNLFALVSLNEYNENSVFIRNKLYKKTNVARFHDIERMIKIANYFK